MHHVFGQALLSIIYMHCYIITYDVTNFCCSLNDRSAFKFQNFMKTIKKMVRHGSNPAAEVARRWKYWKHESSWNICFTIKTKKTFCFQLTNEKMCFLKNNIWEDCHECDTFKLAHTEYLCYTNSLKVLGYWIHKKYEQNWIWSSWNPKERFEKENLYLVMEKWIWLFSNVAQNLKHSMKMIKLV